MTTNELAAILARRRAKNGGESEDAPPLVKKKVTPSSETVPPAGRSSIAERIARLKQQSAATSAANEAATTPPTNPSISNSESTGLFQASDSSVSSPVDVSATSSAPDSVDTSTVTAAQEAAGIRRASNKIQQLQGSLGINVNPFGRSGGPSSGGYRKPSSYQKESIMSTGEEQYGKTQHAMGVAMPGMTGSAIPMPGLVKGGFRLPGMTTGGELGTDEPSAALDNTHATMNRVAGPKRRGPARPPPGAFRLPTMASPTVETVQPAQAGPSIEPVVAAEVLESKALEKSPAVASSQGSVGFNSPSSEPVDSSAPVFAPTTTFTRSPTSAPVPSAAKVPQKLPEPEPIAPMKPYELEDDPYAPVYDTPAEQHSCAPPGFPSALMANFSMDELIIDDQPKPKPVATSTPSPTSASSLFGASSLPDTTSKDRSPPPATPIEPTPAQLVAASDEASSANAGSTPAPVTPPTPAPVFAPMSSELTASSASSPVSKTLPNPAPIQATVPSLPAPSPTPPPTPAGAAPALAPTSGSYLFGAAASAAMEEDDSSESDWSDDDNENQSLFGVPRTAPVVSASNTGTPSRPMSETPTPSDGSLFGDVSASAPGIAPAASQTASTTDHYSSLFGG